LRNFSLVERFVVVATAMVNFGKAAVFALVMVTLDYLFLRHMANAELDHYLSCAKPCSASLGLDAAGIEADQTCRPPEVLAAVADYIDRNIEAAVHVCGHFGGDRWAGISDEADDSKSGKDRRSGWNVSALQSAFLATSRAVDDFFDWNDDFDLDRGFSGRQRRHKMSSTSRGPARTDVAPGYQAFPLAKVPKGILWGASRILHTAVFGTIIAIVAVLESILFFLR
jgi:hypothetical protein